MRTILALLVVVAAAALLAASPSAASLAPGGSYTVTGVDPTGGVLSGDFRYSVLNDPRGPSVTIRDRITGATETYSAASQGAVSRDGRYLAYLQWPSRSLQLRDRVGGAVWVVWPGEVQSFVLSGDGRYLAFAAGGPPTVYLWDRVTGATEQVTGFGNLAPSTPGAEWYEVGPAAFSVEGPRLKIVSTSPSLARWVDNFRATAVTPGAEYDVTAQVETRAGDAARASLSVNFWDARGSYVPATVDSPLSLSGTQGPTQLAVHVRAPANAAFLRVEVRFVGPGTVWAGDVSVTEQGRGWIGAEPVAISGDGGVVAIHVGFGWPIPEPTLDYVLYDRQTDTISDAGLSHPVQSPGGGPSRDLDGVVASISDDGRYVTYEAYGVWAPWHVPQGVTVYRLDRLTGVATPLASTPGGSPSWAISGDGHVFALGRDGGIVVRDLDTGAATTVVGSSYPLQLSADGHLLSFVSGSDVAIAEYGAAGPPPPTPANLAPDPGFEVEPSPWWYENGPAVFSWATDQAHGGTYALKLVSTTTTLARWISVHRAIPVQPGQTFTVSAWVKRQGTTGGSLAVNFWDESSTYVPATVNTPDEGGTSDWKRVELTATAPAGAAYLRVEFRVNGPGTLWADDVSVVRR